MKKIFIALILFVSFIETRAQDSDKQFMQITTVESVVAGGIGRSKLLITNADGSQKEADLDNLFSLAGINFKNIKDNDQKMIVLLKQYTDAGWKLEHITSLTLSQNDSGAGGIFMTRYLLSKPTA